MRSLWLALAAAVLPVAASAGTKVAGTNFHVLQEFDWLADQGAYWQQDNVGSFTVSEGQIQPGFVRCLGAGFAEMSGASGDGICIYSTSNFKLGDDTFTTAWKSFKTGSNTWRIIGSTGRYKGMTGHGTATMRIESEFHAMRLRVSDWEGEVVLPKLRRGAGRARP